MIKKCFVTGLIILLPVALTLAIVIFIINLLTIPFLGAVKTVFTHYHLFEHGFLFFNPDQLETITAKTLIFLFLFLFTISLGYIARWFFFHSFIQFTDYIVRRIPFVSAIYKTCQDIIRTIFTSKTNSFKQVVMVRFPSADSYSLGLITRDEISGFKNTAHEQSVAVFIPTTPNPTSGFLVLFKEKDLIHLDMKVEDAFKYIISCGVILPDFQTMTREDILKHSQKEV